jgi:hypothetical protein
VRFSMTLDELLQTAYLVTPPQTRMTFRSIAEYLQAILVTPQPSQESQFLLAGTAILICTTLVSRTAFLRHGQEIPEQRQGLRREAVQAAWYYSR